MSEYDECGDKDDDRSETDIQVFYERHLGVGRWFRGPQLMPRRFILTGALPRRSDLRHASDHT